MDVKKINEALSDIVSLSSSVMLTDDVKIKEQAIADIVDEIRSVMPELFPSAAKKSKEEVSAEWFKKHYSFCNGLFQIRRGNSEQSVTEHCWIGGRRFTMELSSDIHDAGERVCVATIRDNGKIVIRSVIYRGKSIAERVSHSAFKSYVMNISGSNKYSSRGGFLKQAVKRKAEAAAKAASETMTTVGCPSLRPMPINLPSCFDGVEPSIEELENA